MKILPFISFIIIMNCYLSATIINIPDDQQTIQEGIDIAVDGDTVLVQPGTYEESISFDGKAITVASLFLTTCDSTYIDSTKIFASGYSVTTVYFTNNENNNSVLIGFTIGHESLMRNGIRCSNSSPVIKNNKIIANNDFGIRCFYNSEPLIFHNIFVTYSHGLWYKPLLIVQSSPRIISNTIFGNGPYNYCGIKLENSQNTIIASNRIIGTNCGMSLSGEALVINNLITECEFCGIESNSQSKLINNTIVNNGCFGIKTECIQDRKLQIVLSGEMAVVSTLKEYQFLQIIV